MVLDFVLWIAITAAAGALIGRAFKGNARLGALLGPCGPLGWALLAAADDLRPGRREDPVAVRANAATGMLVFCLLFAIVVTTLLLVL